MCCLIGFVHIYLDLNLSVKGHHSYEYNHVFFDNNRTLVNTRVRRERATLTWVGSYTNTGIYSIFKEPHTMMISSNTILKPALTTGVLTVGTFEYRTPKSYRHHGIPKNRDLG